MSKERIVRVLLPSGQYVTRTSKTKTYKYAIIASDKGKFGEWACYGFSESLRAAQATARKWAWVGESRVTEVEVVKEW